MSEGNNLRYMYRAAIKRGLRASQHGMAGRASQVVRLRSAIEEGGYHVSCSQLAARLLVNQTRFLEFREDEHT